MDDDEATGGSTESVVDPPVDPPTEPVSTPDSTPDNTVYIAKISELEGIIAVKDSEIAALNAALTVSKAANYDLLMGMPKEEETEPIIDTAADESTSGGIDTLFGKKEN